MRYRKESILLVVLGAVLLVLTSASTRADYCDYCSDDNTVYNGSYYETPYSTPYDQYEYDNYTYDLYDTPYETPYPTPASEDQISYDYYDTPYSTPTYYNSSDDYYNSADDFSYTTEVPKLPEDLYTALPDDVTGKPAGMTLEEYYGNPDLTTGFDSPLVNVADYTQSGPGADYGGYYIPNPNAVDRPYLTPSVGSTDNPDPYGERAIAPSSKADFSYGFDPYVFNQDTPTVAGIYQMRTSELTYISPFDTYDPYKHTNLFSYPNVDYYFSPNTLLESQTRGQIESFPTYYTGIAAPTGPARINFADYVNTSVAPEFYGNTERLYSVGGSTAGNSSNYPSYNDYLISGIPSYQQEISAPPVQIPDPQIIYQNQDGIRNLKLSPSLEVNLIAAAKAVGVDKILIASGGQPALSAGEGCGTGGDRTGSTRHDCGNAADFLLVKDGQTLNFTNAADQKIFAAFIAESVRLGATGVGGGTGYMGAFMIHDGFSTPQDSYEGCWGAGGSSANCPDWMREAYNKGIAERTAGVDNTPTASIPPPAGPTARELQEDLKALGYYKGNIDGIIGSETTSAIRAFQTASGLKADGIVGSWTIAALEKDILTPPLNIPNVPSPTPPATTPAPTKPAGDPAIANIQWELAIRGYDPGVIDGKMGPQTEAAIRAFQKANGLQVDGVAGSKTIAVLENAPTPSSIPLPTQSGGAPSAIQIQQELAARGYYKGKIDGIIGSETTSAIRAFQRASGIGVDGIVGPQTLAVLEPTIPTPQLRPDSPVSIVTTVPTPRLRPGDESPAINTVVNYSPSLFTQNGGTSLINARFEPGIQNYFFGYNTLNSRAFIRKDIEDITSPGYISPYGPTFATAPSRSVAQPSYAYTSSIQNFLSPSYDSFYTPTWASSQSQSETPGVPRPHLRPGEESPSYVATPPTVTTPTTVAKPSTVASSESTKIPAGPYGAQVLAKAILTGDPDKIAAAQKQVEANANAEIRASCGSNIFCLGALAFRADAEKAKAQKAVENYLTVTLPAQAPGAVRQFQQKVESDPSLITDLPPDQRVLLDKAFKALPPAPVATQPSTSVSPLSSAESAPEYYVGLMGPTGPTLVSYVDYLNYTAVAPQFSGTTDRMYSFATAPLPSAPVMSKDFSFDDSATVKDLYVYNPATETYYYGYQTLDSSASTDSSQSSESDSQYYYIPPSSGGGKPQEVKTSILPYYIAMKGPSDPTSVNLKNYIDTVLVPQLYGTSENYSNYKNMLWPRTIFTYRRPHQTAPRSATPTIWYSSNSGSGFQPILSWDSFNNNKNFTPSGTFSVDYAPTGSSPDSSDKGDTTPFNARVTGVPPVLTACAGTDQPSATDCTFNILPSLLRKDTAAKLYWNIAGLEAGESCSLTSLPSIAGLPSWNRAGSSWVNASGYSVTISQKTIFTITCRTSNGATVSVSKTVNIAPIIQEI